MLAGRYGGTSGRPYFSAAVFIPRLSVVGNVSFLFDTGADGTMLMAADAKLLGIDYGQLGDERASLGIGGSTTTYVESARLGFADADGQLVYCYDINLNIYGEPDESDPSQAVAMKLPSLFGRDIVRQWDVNYRSPLTAEVLSYDGLCI